jgi:hypothetical protein
LRELPFTSFDSFITIPNLLSTAEQLMQPEFIKRGVETTVSETDE